MRHDQSCAYEAEILASAVKGHSGNLVDLLPDTGENSTFPNSHVCENLLLSHNLATLPGGQRICNGLGNIFII